MMRTMTVIGSAQVSEKKKLARKGFTEYCAASKNFANVDPNCEDWRSIHYAAEDRTYFLVRNKYTKEW